MMKDHVVLVDAKKVKNPKSVCTGPRLLLVKQTCLQFSNMWLSVEGLELGYMTQVTSSVQSSTTCIPVHC